MAFQNGLPAVPVHDLVIHPRENDLVVGTHGRSIYIANISHVQGMQEFAANESIKLFPLSEVNFSERWGTKGWSWADDYFEPKLSIVVFSNSDKDGQLKVLDKDGQVQFSKDVKLDKGLNYIDYNLDSDQGTDEPKDNGKKYLGVGAYKLQITSGSDSDSEDFNVKEPKKRNERKE